MGEIRTVDDDERIRPRGDDCKRGFTDAAKNLRQPLRDGGQPDDRKLVDWKRTGDSGSRHGMPADAGKLHRAGFLLEQCLRQRRAKQRRRIPPPRRCKSKAAGSTPTAAHHSLRGILADANEKNSCAIGRGSDRIGFRDHRGAGRDGETGKTGARDILDRSRTDRGQVEAAILAGFWRLHQNASAGRRGDATDAGAVRRCA